MKIHIIIDSGSDVSKEEAEKYGVTVLPLKTMFGEEEYRDGVDITRQEFYEKLIETDVFPTTSQIAPFEYEEAYEKLAKDADAILVITLSSKLSGCYQSANIAAEEYDNVYIVDSENVAIGQRLLLELAVAEREKGTAIEEIVALLEEKKKQVKLVAKLDTLEYLKKGGRLSAAAAGVGTLLSIKPVVAVEHGEVVILGTARGSKNADNKLRQIVKDAGGINFDMPHALAYSGLSDADLQKYAKDSSELYINHEDHIPMYQIGAVIGAHVGPGTVAAAFFGN